MSDFLELANLLLRDGFAVVPRTVFRYAADLQLDYETVGKLAVVLSTAGMAPPEDMGYRFIVSRDQHSRDYESIRWLLKELCDKDLLLFDEESDRLIFDFLPLLSRLRACWCARQEDETIAHEPTEDNEPPPEKRRESSLLEGIRAAEKLLGRPMTDREIDSMQDWCSTYGFGRGMIEAVVREGLRQGVTRMSYLNQIARHWHDEGITTPAQAQAHLQQFLGQQRKRSARRGTDETHVVSDYIGRSLTRSEGTLYTKWTQDWGFRDEVVIKALAVAQANGAQGLFSYANRILESWLERGLMTTAAIDAATAKPQRRSPTAEQAERPSANSSKSPTTSEAET